MISEYIKRGELLEAHKRAIRAYENANIFNASAIRENLKPLLDAVVDTPAADVAPVVHGSWFLLDDCANAGLYCSVCHRRVHREDFAYKKLRSKYCPHCGAKMDGGTEDG